jgi:hypothetical protein
MSAIAKPHSVMTELVGGKKRGIEMKLYWRLKKKGKWTWRPVKVHAQEAEGDHESWFWYLIEAEEE